VGAKVEQRRLPFFVIFLANHKTLTTCFVVHRGARRLQMMIDGYFMTDALLGTPPDFFVDIRPVPSPEYFSTPKRLSRVGRWLT
jgi:hypothetical protein